MSAAIAAGETQRQDKGHHSFAGLVLSMRVPSKTTSLQGISKAQASRGAHGKLQPGTKAQLQGVLCRGQAYLACRHQTERGQNVADGLAADPVRSWHWGRLSLQGTSACCPPTFPLYCTGQQVISKEVSCAAQGGLRSSCGWKLQYRAACIGSVLQAPGGFCSSTCVGCCCKASRRLQYASLNLLAHPVPAETVISDWPRPFMRRP